MLTLRKVILLYVWRPRSRDRRLCGDDRPAPATTTPGSLHWHRHGHHRGFMCFVLHKLKLTAAQKTQIKGIFAGEKSQFEALHASVKANREALADDRRPRVPITGARSKQSTGQCLAAHQARSETWSAIYTSVLTKAQHDAIPGIVAAAKAAARSRMAAWEARRRRSVRPAIDGATFSAGPRRCRPSSGDR